MKIGYLAGKYSGKDVDANIALARMVSIEFWKNGIPIITPHLNTAHFELEKGLEDGYDIFLNGYLDILGKLDYIVFLPNFSESKGAMMELIKADNMGIDIYFLEDILEDIISIKSQVEFICKDIRSKIENNMVYKPILEEASSIVNKGIRNEYPEPVENFKIISEIASSIGNKFLSPIDCVNVLISVKLSREKYSHKRDNLVDLSGYAEIKNMIYESGE